jgi:hypothetical protein
MNKILDYLYWWWNYSSFINGWSFYTQTFKQVRNDRKCGRSWKRHGHHRARIGERMGWCQECQRSYGISEVEEVKELLNQYD